jgi:hypothetical protein
VFERLRERVSHLPVRLTTMMRNEQLLIERKVRRVATDDDE